MLNSKQRAKLLALSQTLDPVVMIGKKGGTEEVAAMLDKALGDHELVKTRFIDFKGQKREIAEELAAKTDSDIVRIIGNVAIFFRIARIPEKRKIVLP